MAESVIVQRLFEPGRSIGFRARDPAFTQSYFFPKFSSQQPFCGSLRAKSRVREVSDIRPGIGSVLFLKRLHPWVPTIQSGQEMQSEAFNRRKRQSVIASTSSTGMTGVGDEPQVGSVAMSESTRTILSVINESVSAKRKHGLSFSGLHLSLLECVVFLCNLTQWWH
jgi:hypothetical protein